MGSLMASDFSMIVADGSNINMFDDVWVGEYPLSLSGFNGRLLESFLELVHYYLHGLSQWVF